MVAAVSVAATLLLLAQRGNSAAPHGLATFWADFARTDRETTLFFPNLGFSDVAGAGPCYAKPLPSSTPALYAGIGEVYASGELASLFGRYWRPLNIRRNRAFSWDDGRWQNLILMGGVCVNPQIRDLPPLRRYRFGINRSDPEAGAYIEDLHPAPRQPRTYGSDVPLSFDHAIVAMMRFGNNQRCLLLAGSTTLGTLGAVDFVSQEDAVRSLVEALEKQRPGLRGKIPDFEALLEVRIRNDVPVESRVIGIEVWDH